MFKQLKLYYIIVTLPFALLLLGSAFFFKAIKATISLNPHPQINYAIFVIVLFGGGLIVFSAHCLIREAKTLMQYAGATRAKAALAALQEMANRSTGDLACLLQLVAASGGRSISHQEQAAIEHELANARARLTRRNALPQYLTGLLVGMGLLGTFIGLLSTLQDITALISSFADLDMKNVNPIEVFRVMIERMKAPMQSMGIAFSASMFGLLGSIILGLMMVGIRRLQGDILSLLGSEVARHIETGLSHEVDAAPVPEGVANGGGAGFSGEEAKILLRIEERLAEAARLQQRTLAAEIDDFRKQRADMLRALGEQTDASNSFRSELQQLGRQLGTVFSTMEKGSGAITSQISELAVNLAGGARESHKLLALQVAEQKQLRETLDGHKIEEKLADAARQQQGALSAEKFTQICESAVHLAAGARESQKLLTMQVDEQRRLRDTLDAYKIEERLAEAARLQQRALAEEIDDFQKQRADMLRTLAEQTEASNSFRSELQQLGRQLGTIFTSMEQGNTEITGQISELTVHLAAATRESNNLLALQVSEQKRLTELLAPQTKSSAP